MAASHERMYAVSRSCSRRERDVLVSRSARTLELVHLAEAGREHAVGARTRECMPCSRRDVEAALRGSARPALDLAGHEVRRADRVERERLDVGVADLLARARGRACPSELPRRCRGSACEGSPGPRTRTRALCRAAAPRGSRSTRDSPLRRGRSGRARSPPTAAARGSLRGGVGRRARGRARSPAVAPRASRRSGRSAPSRCA